MKGKILKLLTGTLLATAVLAAGLVMGPKETKADDVGAPHCGRHLEFDGECQDCKAAACERQGHIFYDEDGEPNATCLLCGYTCSHPEITESDWYSIVGEKHGKQCKSCFCIDESTLQDHTYIYYGKSGNVHDISCSVCDILLGGENCQFDEDDTCIKCGHKKTEEKKEKKKKTESSSSSSSSKQSTPALTPAQQAKVTEQAQAVVGSKEYSAKQAEVQKAIVSTLASVATMTREQASEYRSMGIPVNLGGCTTIDNKSVATMIANSSMPYNMAFNWNGVTFSVRIPAGANYINLLDANGNLPMWKIVQIYGIRNAVLAK